MQIEGIDKLDDPLCACAYVKDYLPLKEADELFFWAKSHITWKQAENFICGQDLKSPRLISAFGDNNVTYTYSRKTKAVEKWPKELEKYLEIFGTVHPEKKKPNMVIGNLYRNGEDKFTKNSHERKEYIKNSPIFVLMLGATRKMVVHPKKKGEEGYKDRTKFSLEHGSLLVMGGEMQSRYCYEIPLTRKQVDIHINLTFCYVDPALCNPPTCEAKYIKRLEFQTDPIKEIPNKDLIKEAKINDLSNSIWDNDYGKRKREEEEEDIMEMAIKIRKEANFCLPISETYTWQYENFERDIRECDTVLLL